MSKVSKNIELVDSRVTNKKTLAGFSNHILWLVTRLTYEAVADEVYRSTGWLSHAVSRRWHKIKPTPLDIVRIELYYLIEKKHGREGKKKDEELKKALSMQAESQEILRKYIRQYKRATRKPKRNRKRATRNGNR